MRFYNTPQAYYCGVDLHARSMFTHILDSRGDTVLASDLAANPDVFLKAIAPYRQGLVVGCECMFAWYWLADLCEDHSIPFTLGHALYMKLIHGGKAKNDKIDAAKIAALLRGGMFPMAYVYPRGKRATRDLLRRRSHFVRHRAPLITHITNTNSQYNLPPFTAKLSRASNRGPFGGPFLGRPVQFHFVFGFPACLRVARLGAVKVARHALRRQGKRGVSALSGSRNSSSASPCQKSPSCNFVLVGSDLGGLPGS
jgi:hypothetical protein